MSVKAVRTCTVELVKSIQVTEGGLATTAWVIRIGREGHIEESIINVDLKDGIDRLCALLKWSLIRELMP
jgi:hypothetical protein